MLNYTINAVLTIQYEKYRRADIQCNNTRIKQYGKLLMRCINGTGWKLKVQSTRVVQFMCRGNCQWERWKPEVETSDV